jgi:protocatechuate 3,4-dioxygenase alpha subunit
VRLVPTPSQTVGPFFSIGLRDVGLAELVAPDDVDAVRLGGVVLDGEGDPVVDALVEIWQANRAGRYLHPEDGREHLPLEDGFTGFGRCATDDQGRYEFVTVKPGRVPNGDGALQAPHVAVTVLARGLLKHLTTRVYFPDEVAANAADPVLCSIAEADDRDTLIAKPRARARALSFDIRLQGDRETVFLRV